MSGTFILIDGIITATCCVTDTLAQPYCIAGFLVDTAFGLLAAFAFTKIGRVTGFTILFGLILSTSIGKRSSNLRGLKTFTFLVTM